MFVTDCPRCTTKAVTFDALSASIVPRTADRYFTFGRCRACYQPTIFELHNVRGNKSPLSSDFAGEIINSVFELVVSKPVLRNTATCPEFVPDNIRTIFEEASLCYAIGAFDASGAMSRKVLDAATRELIPVEPQSVDKSDPNYLSWKVAKDLRLRLDWLFERKILPSDLADLASCVHQDGNDAAHASETIGEEGALDLQEFTTSILETLYTRPGRIAQNVERRERRRLPPSG
ncbi:DUF4145 domain-containing protein [Sphingomonas sp. CV7422]|uniref:DUF4145 domain-containing protein n=1 Tax=Sphingomonas sp. CV7422 TaxID=3018036 RepID=UPI0022FE4AAD|nr:DUF4145 domain-containing protein [Sphingomonas sp. CV7422]